MTHIRKNNETNTFLIQLLRGARSSRYDGREASRTTDDFTRYYRCDDARSRPSVVVRPVVVRDAGRLYRDRGRLRSAGRGRVVFQPDAGVRGARDRGPRHGDTAIRRDADGPSDGLGWPDRSDRHTRRRRVRRVQVRRERGVRGRVPRLLRHRRVRLGRLAVRRPIADADGPCHVLNRQVRSVL